jgi:hypothetical protein
VQGNQQGCIGILIGNHADGAITYSQIVGQVNFFKRGILAYQLNGEGAGLPLTGDLRVLIAGSPAIVMGLDSSEDPLTWLRREESLVTPLGGESSRKLRVVDVGYQPPTTFRFQTKHRVSP